MDLLQIGDSTCRGYVGSVLSPWGGSRGGLLRLLRQQYDVRPVGPTVQAEYPEWGPFWAATPLGTIAGATPQVAAVIGALAHPPDLITVGLGINDILNTTPAELPPTSILDDLEDLILALTTAAPDASLWVGQVSPTTASEDAANMAGLFNARVSAPVQAAREAGANVRAVASMAGITSGHLADGVHFTESGYTLIAENWYRALTTPIRPLP